MSSRENEGPELRAVDALAREAAEEEVPELDWARIEGKLLASVAKGAPKSSAVSDSNPVESPAAPARASRARKIGSPWAIAVAAAAGVALVLASQREARDTSPLSAEGSAREAIAGAPIPEQLERGDIVETGASPLTHTVEGVLSFTVAPWSRIEVVTAPRAGDLASPLVVALARGSIHAEVTPRPHGEVFAVEVGRTRVGVHGTAFTITRGADRAIVEVTHGSVAIGPAGQSSTGRWLLVGPDRASFSLDGADDASFLGDDAAGAKGERATGPGGEGPSLSPSEHGKPAFEAPAPRGGGSAGSSGSAGSTFVAPDPAPPGQQAVSAAAAPESSGAPTRPHGAARVHPEVNRDPATADSGALAASELAAPSAAGAPSTHDVPRTDDAAARAIVSGLEGCYQRQAKSFGFRFSVRSSLTLSILPSGAVREGLFDPPLSPTLHACAGEALSGIRFESSTAPRQIRIPVSLAQPGGD